MMMMMMMMMMMKDTSIYFPIYSSVSPAASLVSKVRKGSEV